MICICEYDENRDKREVDQFGFIDLAECMVNGQVPSTIADSEANYNGIDDPSSILGKPSDIFEGIRMMNTIKERSTKKSDE